MSGFKFPLVSFLYPSEDFHHPGPWNEVAETVLLWLVSGKFMSIFAFLFGVGLALQEKRAASRGLAFGPFIRWRMVLLLAAGVIHGILLWPGDILAVYGIFGLLSPILLGWRARTLAGVVLAIALISIAAHVILTLAFHESGAVYADRESIELWIEGYRQASLPGVIQLRIQEWKMVWVTAYLSDFSYAFLFFVTGLATGKSGRFLDWLSPGFKVGRGFVIAFLVALVITIIALIIFRGPEPISRDASIFAYLAILVGNWMLAWGYMAGFARLHTRIAASDLMKSLRCVGRMSLTNYLLQSIIANAVFMPFGLGLYGQASFCEGLALSAIIFAFQMIFSRWWLSRHNSGPAEYLWRALSYPR
ncbi:DUF418 domain-containing protein [Luteolibacter flavescens]|nr:DUF418 domain-containing protein [Luteolibacter flavescens]